MQNSSDKSHDDNNRGRPRGILVRLARDTRGNTLAIVGAALVPLAAMIGSGVDMARAYMAKTRLQSACDAASLAARHAMTNLTLVDPTVRSEANKFFNFNFPQGLYQTAAFTPTVTSPAAGTIHITASTTIPTTIMHMFGFTNLPLSVTCDASQNFVNTDIVLVLDTTGSMANDVNDNPTGDPTKSKIQALRDAVMTLYDQLAPMQTQLEAQGLRLRYAVVPYSSSVNVGKLITAVNPAYVTDTHTYQSRVAAYTTPTYVANTPTTAAPVEEDYSSSISKTDCASYGTNSSFSGFSRSATTGGGPAPAATTTNSYTNNTSTDWGYAGGSDTSGTNESCRRFKTVTTTTYKTLYKASSSNAWTYQQVAGIDTSKFKLGNSVSYATQSDGTVPTAGTYDPVQIAALATGATTASSSWNGCIEERDTDSSINTSSSLTIPSGAYDLNANFIPNSTATRWRPMWPELVWERRTSTNTTIPGPTAITSFDSSLYACPTAAKRLAAWQRSDLLSYVNSLTPKGGTYHDIGLIWGARMISSGGIFADSPDTFLNVATARFMIFLTDGQLAPNFNSYSAYGVEYMDQRVTGTYTTQDPDQTARHAQRFRDVCQEVKGLNTSIWVIALGTSLSDDLTNCASNSNQASTIADRDALIAQFALIGQNIGKLRLTQ
jgi:Flp pilus assembly protein TadG